MLPCRDVHVGTAWEPLDVLEGPPRPSPEVAVHGVPVRVAA